MAHDLQRKYTSLAQFMSAAEIVALAATKTPEEMDKLDQETRSRISAVFAQSRQVFRSLSSKR